MQSLSSERRQARARRRRQVRRRRFAALAVVIILVVVAVSVAYALPTATPAHLPAAGAASPFAKADGVSRQVVVARLESIDVLLPVPPADTTAVAFHPVDNANTVPFAPSGSRLNDQTLATTLSDIFKQGGGVQYYMMSGNGSDGSSSTSGLDVGAVPGVFVYSPVSGHVTAVKEYKLLGRYTDYEIDIQLADDPSLLLILTHVTRPRVAVGDMVRAGDSLLGRVRGFPQSVQQSLKQFTADAGDHVQLVAVRIAPNLAGF